MQIEIVTSPEGAQTVDARILHEFLEVKTRFNDWIISRVREFEFIEGKDFSLTEISVSGNNSIRKDYILSVSMAKELSMLERSSKGKLARRYFIDCEELLKNPPLSDTQDALLKVLHLFEAKEVAMVLAAFAPAGTPHAGGGIRRGCYVHANSRTDEASRLWETRLAIEQLQDAVNGQLRLAI